MARGAVRRKMTGLWLDGTGWNKEHLPAVAWYQAERGWVGQRPGVGGRLIDPCPSHQRRTLSTRLNCGQHQLTPGQTTVLPRLLFTARGLHDFLSYPP